MGSCLWLLILLLLHANGRIMPNGKSPSKKMKRDKSVHRKKPIVPQPKTSILNQAMKGWGDVLEAVSVKTRDLKAYFSSDFEALLLKLTQPDATRPSSDEMNQVIATIESFARNMDVADVANPYRVTLHKLWSKMTEPSVWTKLKALLILHSILRYTEPEDAIIFKALLAKMTKEHCTKSASKYFDLSKVHVSDREEGAADFLRSYSAYVMKRSRAFTAQFEEIKVINKDMRTEDICAQLLKANKLINSALHCRADGSEEVVAGCLELVARDLKELFVAYYDKLHWLLLEEEQGFGRELFEGWKLEEVEAVFGHFKSFYDDRVEAVQAFVMETNARLVEIGVTIPMAMDIPRSMSDKDRYVSREEHPAAQRRTRSTLQHHTVAPLSEVDDDERDVTSSDEYLDFPEEDDDYDGDDEPTITEASPEFDDDEMD